MPKWFLFSAFCFFKGPITYFLWQLTIVQCDKVFSVDLRWTLPVYHNEHISMNLHANIYPTILSTSLYIIMMTAKQPSLTHHSTPWRWPLISVQSHDDLWSVSNLMMMTSNQCPISCWWPLISVQSHTSLYIVMMTSDQCPVSCWWPLISVQSHTSLYIIMMTSDQCPVSWRWPLISVQSHTSLHIMTMTSDQYSISWWWPLISVLSHTSLYITTMTSDQCLISHLTLHHHHDLWSVSNLMAMTSDQCPVSHLTLHHDDDLWSVSSLPCYPYITDVPQFVQ